VGVFFFFFLKNILELFINKLSPYILTNPENGLNPFVSSSLFNNKDNNNYYNDNYN